MFELNQIESLVLYSDERIDNWESIFEKYCSKFRIRGIICKSYHKGKYSKINLEDADKNDFILIIGENWMRSACFLEENGYLPYKNFIPEWYLDIIHPDNYFDYNSVKNYAHKNVIKMGEIFKFIRKNKPIAAIYANCQSMYISALLRTNSDFNKKYIMCNFPFIQHIAEEKNNGFSEEYMKEIDLFIYQNVSVENVFGRMLATQEYVLPLLNRNAIKISIPFVYFNGYFPQYIRNRRNDDVRRGEGHTPYGDEKIQTLVEKGTSTEAIVKILNDVDLFSIEELEENVENSLCELRKREEKCDVVISDIIENQYKNNYLFYSPSHPTNYCLKFLVQRILKRLCFENIDISLEGLRENDRVEMFIYPSVKNKLGLTFGKNAFAFNRNVSGLCNIKQYVEKYIEYNFPEKNIDDAITFRTIDVDYMLNINKLLVTERRPKILLLNGRMCHLNLYLTIERDNPEGIIADIPSEYAPKRSILFVATAFGKGAFPITLRESGEFYVNFPVKKGQVVLIDAAWYMK